MDPNMTRDDYQREIDKMVDALKNVEDGTRLTAGELADMAGAITSEGKNIFCDLDTYGILDDFLGKARKCYYLDDSENDDMETGLVRTYSFIVYRK